MAGSGSWDRAALVPVRRGEKRAELAALPVELPSVPELFTFMRDAERRFETLKLRIEERTYGARGRQIATVDVALRHPGHARVVTTEPGTGAAGHNEVWISDGEIVRTYASAHGLGTQRPVRNRPRGLDDPDLPGTAKVYEPVTALPMETLPDTFVHPAGYCQNVLSTGRSSVSGTAIVHGREAILVACDHPRTTEVAGDRPDFHISLAVDRDTGVILRLVESIGGGITRHAEVVELAPDSPLPSSAFEFSFPTGTVMLY